MKNFTYTIVFTIFLLLISHSSFSQTTATYDITFESTWNATQHSSIPSGAHWSDLVGATHKNENEYFELGQNASIGIKDVAELGNNANFMSQVQNSSNTKQWLQGYFNPFAAISSATLTNVEFTEEHHLITLVSMIAPSPDWFIAINSLDLRNATNTAWKNSFTIDVFVYDSGTDSGTNYNSTNATTNPVQAITKINGFPFNGIKVGTLTVTQKSVLSVNNFNAEKAIKIYPNPSNGTININNLKTIKTVEFFTVLGQKVKQINTNQNNKLSLQLNGLKKGIYLVKFINNNGNTKVKKLVLE